MGKGKLIIIESGSDASGKATQSQRLYERLIQEGVQTLVPLQLCSERQMIW